MLHVSLLLRLLTRQAEEEVVEQGGELVADQDPVLVNQVVGGDVGVGPSKGLLQGVPLEGGHHVVLCVWYQRNRNMALVKSQNGICREDILTILVPSV